MAVHAPRVAALVACVFALGAVASPAVAVPVRHAAPAQAFESSVLTEINAVRASRGLRPLVLSNRLSAAARQHSVEMAAHGYFEHSSANGSPFDRRIARFYPMGRFHYWEVGENLVYQSPDLGADEAVGMWMHSPPHRANLLSRRWRDIGLAAVHAGSAPGDYEGMPVSIITADFGLRR
jgi:uncharacterized protein YkwD